MTVPDDPNVRRMYALVTDQDTAMGETALCEECFTATNKLDVAMTADVDESGGDFQDCTGNEALQCVKCGYGESWWDR